MIRSAVAFAALSCCSSRASFFFPSASRPMLLGPMLLGPRNQSPPRPPPPLRAQPLRASPIRISIGPNGSGFPSAATGGSSRSIRWRKNSSISSRAAPNGPIPTPRRPRAKSRTSFGPGAAVRLDHPAGGVDRPAHLPLRVPAAPRNPEHRQDQDPRRRDVRLARADPRLETVATRPGAPSTGRRILKSDSTRCSARQRQIARQRGRHGRRPGDQRQSGRAVPPHGGVLDDAARQRRLRRAGSRSACPHPADRSRRPAQRLGLVGRDLEADKWRDERRPDDRRHHGRRSATTWPASCSIPSGGMRYAGGHPNHPAQPGRPCCRSLRRRKR